VKICKIFISKTGVLDQKPILDTPGTPGFYQKYPEPVHPLPQYYYQKLITPNCLFLKNNLIDEKNLTALGHPRTP